MSVASIEGRFHAELLRLLEIDPATLPAQRDRAGWPKVKALLAERFRTRTRADWCALLEGTDACFAPVLSMDEAASHPHNQARGAFIEVGGVRSRRRRHGSRAPRRHRRGRRDRWMRARRWRRSGCRRRRSAR